MLDPQKQALIKEVERLKPELPFEEHKAVERLSRTMEKHGFSVERSVAGLDTAFTASRASAEGPTIAFLAEYDALPGLGHACGHNLIAAGSLGAALALKAALGEVDGRVLVVGCPAEEKGGGKIPLVDSGGFQGADPAMWAPPSTGPEIGRGLSGCGTSRWNSSARRRMPRRHPISGGTRSMPSSSPSTTSTRFGNRYGRTLGSTGSLPTAARPRISFPTMQRPSSTFGRWTWHTWRSSTRRCWAVSRRPPWPRGPDTRSSGRGLTTTRTR